MTLEELIRQAESGDAEAQYQLGLKYNKGDGVELDFNKAVYWFSKSAENGCSNGINALGVCYYYGEGVEKDVVKATELYAQAAELIMKLDYEINQICQGEMNTGNPNYGVFDETLNLALRERGMSEQVIDTVRSLCQKQNSFYFVDFIRKYL